MRVLLVATLLVGACAPQSATDATPTPSLAHSLSPTPTSVATQSTLQTATFAHDPLAQWPAVLYQAEGFIVSQRTESATREIARPCGPVSRLDARPAGLLVSCRAPSSDNAEIRLISIPDGRVTVIASGVHSSWPADVSPDGRTAAAFRLGACPSPAPVCQTRAVLIDVPSKTEREILPSGYHLGATIEWNALGLTLFQPECADAGCAGPGERSGTFVWDGSAFKKWSDLRFVARSGDWTLLERLTSFGREPRAAVIRGPQGEKELSAGHALAISDNGEALVWSPGPALLIRFAPDGRVLWQAEFANTVLKMIGSNALLAVTPTNKLELVDLKRMLRFPIDAPFAIAGVAR